MQIALANSFIFERRTTVHNLTEVCMFTAKKHYADSQHPAECVF